LKIRKPLHSNDLRQFEKNSSSKWHERYKHCSIVSVVRGNQLTTTDEKMVKFLVSFNVNGFECLESVQAENVEQAVIFARDQARRLDGVFGKASDVVVRCRFQYAGKQRSGLVVDHGCGKNGDFLKLDEGQSHPKTFTLANVG